MWQTSHVTKKCHVTSVASPTWEQRSKSLPRAKTARDYLYYPNHLSQLSKSTYLKGCRHPDPRAPPSPDISRSHHRHHSLAHRHSDASIFIPSNVSPNILVPEAFLVRGRSRRWR